MSEYYKITGSFTANNTNYVVVRTPTAACTMTEDEYKELIETDKQTLWCRLKCFVNAKEERRNSYV